MIINKNLYCTVCFSKNIENNKCLDCGFESIAEIKDNENIINICRENYLKINNRK